MTTQQHTPAMASDDDSAPAVRFKRRKLAHARKTFTSDAQDSRPRTADGGAGQDADAGEGDNDDDEAVPNLRDMIRQRKRPQDRSRDAARKAAERKAMLATATARQLQGEVARAVPAPDRFNTRFVAQTGQFVDRDDEQMAKYVEARLAEKNHEEYGWPVPAHLAGLVASFAREKETEREKQQERAAVPVAKPAHDTRMAAGLGKLQEIDLGPVAAATNLRRIEEARRRLEGLPDPAHATPDDGSRAAQPQKRRRPPKRRNSEDVRRDLMVEAVLREAKFDYFAEDKPPSPPANGGQDTDEAFYENFRREYENQESSNQRRPAMPPPAKGVKEPPKGPKLGGSRSARAAMRLQEEQAAKNKR